MIKLSAVVAAGCRAEVTLFGIFESAGDSKPLLDSLARGQALLADKKIRAELITKSGDPVEEILRRTEEAPYDLVVAGSALSRGLRTYVLGDVTREIVNRINSAVRVVRTGERPVLSRFRLGRWFGRAARSGAQS